MRNLRIVGVLIATFGLTACLNSTTLVKLKTDGSGTIEQTTLMNMAALKGMTGGAGQPQSSGPVMNTADLERAAERMGKGVKLVSTEPAKGAAGWEGTKAIFSFEDINQIQLNTEPGMGGDRPMAAAPKGEDPVKFKFTRNGATSTLNIDFIDKPAAGANTTQQPSEMPDLTNPMIMNMLKSMFQGFKVNVDLEVVGTIVKTNAAYVAGPRMTLLEMDMGALLADEAKLKALQGKIGPDASFSELKPYLKDIKGIKIDGPSISVEFR